MRDLVRKYVEAGAGMINAERAEELANDLIEWSRRSTERVVAIVQREVKRQLRLAGAATQDELRELRKRVRSLERQVERLESSGSKPSGSKRSGSKPSGSKRSGSKPSGSKRSTKRSTSRRSGEASGRSGRS